MLATMLIVLGGLKKKCIYKKPGMYQTSHVNKLIQASQQPCGINVFRDADTETLHEAFRR